MIELTINDVKDEYAKLLRKHGQSIRYFVHLAEHAHTMGVINRTSHNGFHSGLSFKDCANQLCKDMTAAYEDIK